MRAFGMLCCFFLIICSSCQKKSGGDDLPTSPYFPLEKAASFPGMPRSGSIGASLNAKGYILWGDNNSNNNYITPTDLWQYDPIGDAWTQKAPFPGDGRMRSRGAVMIAAGNKLYAGLGGAHLYYYYDFWEYDPAADSWTIKDSLQKFIKGGFGTASKCYLLGHNYADYGPAIDSNIIYEYDPTTNTWRQKAAMTAHIVKSRSYSIEYAPAPSFSIGESGYFLFNVVESTYSGKNFWEYNSETDTWTQRSNYPAILIDGSNCVKASFAINGKGYIFVKNNSSTTVWRYDPPTDKWESATVLEPAVYLEIASFAIGPTAYIGLPTQNGDRYYSNFWQFVP